jgi:hypothetical protein
MEIAIKDNGRMVKLRDLESTYGSRERDTLVNLKSG